MQLFHNFISPIRINWKLVIFLFKVFKNIDPSHMLNEKQFHYLFCILLLIKPIVSTPFYPLSCSFELILSGLLDHDLFLNLLSRLIHIFIIIFFQNFMNKAIMQDFLIDEIMDDSCWKVSFLGAWRHTILSWTLKGLVLVVNSFLNWRSLLFLLLKYLDILGKIVVLFLEFDWRRNKVV